MRQMLNLIMSTVLILLFIPSVSGQEIKKENGYWISEATQIYKTQSKGTMKIVDVEGDVQVNVSKKQEVKITFRCKMDIFSENEAKAAAEQLKNCVEQTGNHILIDGTRCQRSWMNLDYYITLPEAFALNIELDAGDVEVEGLQGDLHCQSGAGDIDCKKIGGKADIITGGGDVDLLEMSQDVEVKTGGGDVDGSRLNGVVHVKTGGGEVALKEVEQAISIMTGGGEVSVAGCKDKVDIQTGGGEVAIESCSGHVNVQTGGGEVEANDLDGDLSVQTGGGDVVANRIIGSVRAQTGGGDIELTDVHAGVSAISGGGEICVKFAFADINPDHSVELKNGGGDIELQIPENFKATVNATIETNSRYWSDDFEINTDFPLSVKSATNERGKKIMQATGDINGGGSPVMLKTSQGDIVIHKRIQ